MFIEPVDENELFNVLMKLNSKKSAGPDEITSDILKHIAAFISKPLTFLINLSFSTSSFPDVLKTAKVIPVFKKGDKSDPSNYRPIALLSTISKVIEKLMYNRIVSFMTRHKILTLAQHGFREGRSTITAMEQFLGNLYNLINCKEKCIGIYADLSKAFDLVDHSLLLEKLVSLGLRGKINDWIYSYLSDRAQYVQVSNRKSDSKSVFYGVPQGSILGPLLFILYINGLAELHDLLTMYADDNNCISSSKTSTGLVHKTQELVNKLVNWFQSNKLILNTSKTTFQYFTPRNNLQNESFLIKINGKSLEQTQTVQFLGILIDSDLEWKSHIQGLNKKLSSSCYALLRLRPLANMETLMAYYYAHFHSRISYGIQFWGSSSYVNIIFRMQKRALRNIVGITKRTSCRIWFKKLKLLTLPCLYIYKMLIYVKFNHYTLKKNNCNHSYETRNKDDLLLPAHSTTMYSKSFIYMGTKLFNCLPCELKNLKNMNLFKSRIRKFLMEAAFYNVVEYYQYDINSYFRGT